MQLMIISGASSGIGAAMAKLAADAGHTVASISRRPGPGHHLTADLSNPKSWGGAGDWMEGLIRSQSWDRVVFVHNAGVIEPIGFAGEVDTDAALSNVMLNSAAPQVLGSRFLAAVAKADIMAQLMLISSGASQAPIQGWSSYCAGKAATDMWAAVAGAEQDDRKSSVTVLSVAPGVVDTEMQGAIREADSDDFPSSERFHNLHSSGGLTSPADVARVLLQLTEINAGDSFGGIHVENGARLDIRDFAQAWASS
ncbi:MAG: SDR family NAD(P)-dependent oxidoreductase [Acidimicrobiales bacterium]|nr:SDR family NAD(P)-dependent oxidoreductase [Acidimicrobiales bacterium]